MTDPEVHRNLMTDQGPQECGAAMVPNQQSQCDFTIAFNWTCDEAEPPR